MKAATLVAPDRIAVAELPDPVCEPGDVLVRMLGVGLYGVYHGHRPVPELAWIVGHEAVGEIVAAGTDVDAGRIGPRVAIEPNPRCRGAIRPGQVLDSARVSSGVSTISNEE